MDVIDVIQLIQKEYDDQQMISKMMEMGTNAYIRKLPTPRKLKPKKIKNRYAFFSEYFCTPKSKL